MLKTASGRSAEFLRPTRGIALGQVSVRRGGMRLPCLLTLSLAVLSLTAGCQTGTVKAVVPISDGGQITIPLSKDGPPVGEGEGYRVQSAALTPGKGDREAFYGFVLVANREPSLRHIKIEDISDEKAAFLYEDADPQFTSRVWSGKTDLIAPEDPRLKWVYQITMSMRVYRFTLTAKDGHVITFNHVTVYPPFIKGAIRAKFGEKY